MRPPRRRARRATTLMVGERDGLAADDLAGLVALAGDAEHVARPEHGDRRGGSPRARSPISIASGRAGEDRRADRRRILRARIVVGDDDDVGMLGRGLAHQRPLAGVAVAAGAEDDDEPARGHRPERREHARQRVGLVGVVDEDQRAVRLAPDEFQPPGRALELGERRRTPSSASTPAPMASPAATSAFDAWKAPASGSRIVVAAGRRPRRRARWRKPFGVDVDDADLAARRGRRGSASGPRRRGGGRPRRRHGRRPCR